MEVKIKYLTPTAQTPTYGSEKAAGADLYADICGEGFVQIPPHSTVKIGTGLAITPPEGYFGAIFARSGLATKAGLRPANCVGVCDEDYTGEYIVPLHNDTDDVGIVHHGDRIAQLVFLPYTQVNFTRVAELNTTARGDGGFGSSGK